MSCPLFGGLLGLEKPKVHLDGSDLSPILTGQPKFVRHQPLFLAPPAVESHCRDARRGILFGRATRLRDVNQQHVPGIVDSDDQAGWLHQLPTVSPQVGSQPNHQRCGGTPRDSVTDEDRTVEDQRKYHVGRTRLAFEVVTSCLQNSFNCPTTICGRLE